MKKLIVLILCALMLFSLAACGGESSATPTPEPAPTPEAPPEPDPVELALADYKAALSQLLAADGLTAQLTVDIVRSVKGLSYAEHIEEELKFQGMQGDSPIIVRNQNISFFNTQLPHEYVFSGGNVYIDDLYSVAISAEDYLASLYPLQLFDNALYDTVEYSGDTLFFSDATAAESWLDEGIDFVSAEASAVMSGTELDKVSYSALYSQNAVDVSLSVTLDIASFDAGPDLRASVPTSTDLVELSDLRIIDLFDRALHAPSGSEAQTGEVVTVYSVSAGGAVMTETTALNSYGSGEDLEFKLEYTQNLVENGQVYNWTSSESYIDGLYRYESDGEVAEEELGPNELDPALLLTDYLLLPEILSDISLSELDGYYLIEFGGVEHLGQVLQGVICDYLYGDKTLLDSLATGYATDSLSGWLSVNADTLLPEGYGLEYLGHHSIEGMDCPIGLSNYVSFDLCSTTAYEKIKGEVLPDEEPETKASPLFYKVSGDDGQEMWLMGTIHVGDERTAYLPDSIYAALEASDALAVEVDVSELEKQISDDPALAAQYAAAMMYTDGSTLSGHIEPELYDAAVKQLKAVGNYVYTMEMMTPAAWANIIEQGYLNDGSALVAEKGVDMRLLSLAEEKGIEVREVESMEDQLAALFGGSEALQEYLLESAVKTLRAEYNEQVAELYELWCSGDEAALTEAINSESADITEEDMPLYQEYAKAMYTDRNANMHETAVSYLESGDTVFYAVGLAHLLGMDGLVDSLRAAGYTVELVG